MTTDEHRGLNIDTPFQYSATPGTSADGEGVFALVDAQGYQLVKLASGTIELEGADIGISGGTLNSLYAGTVTSIPAITGTTTGTVFQQGTTTGTVFQQGTVTGSVFGTVGGTVQSVGTGQVVGTVQSIGSTVFTTGTVTSIAGGTVQTQGTEQVVGTVQTQGTHQVEGTVQSIGTVSLPEIEHLHEDFYIQVAAGDVDGYNNVYVHGDNPDVGNTMETICPCGGVYKFLDAAGTIGLASTSIHDNVGSSGAKEVTITGLDGDWDVGSETLSLTGSVPVYSTNEYIRINKLAIGSAGSHETNVGSVYSGTGAFTAGVPAAITRCIPPDHGRSHAAVYTIPNGKTGYLVSLGAWTALSKATSVKLEKRPFNNGWRAVWGINIISGGADKVLAIPHTMTQKTDVKMSAEVSVGGGAVNAHFSIVEVDNG